MKELLKPLGILTLTLLARLHHNSRDGRGFLGRRGGCCLGSRSSRSSSDSSGLFRRRRCLLLRGKSLLGRRRRFLRGRGGLLRRHLLGLGGRSLYLWGGVGVRVRRWVKVGAYNRKASPFPPFRTKQKAVVIHTLVAIS